LLVVVLDAETVRCTLDVELI